jgi:hypothetical protein
MHRISLPGMAAAAAGILLMALAVVYAAEPAASLPSFLPGHVGPADAEHAHHHVKHAVAALAVGLAAFAYAWFQTGPAARSAAAS